MFPIDLVYTWVDGNDENHMAQKIQYSRSVRGDANHVNRYRSSGEIYESIKSALLFAPWIRHIFVLVADIQVDRFQMLDEWTGDSKKLVTVVPHSTVYYWDSHHLPVFNSHSIETHLFQIPGLSEHFLYANDDTFFGAPVQSEQFFTNDGLPVVYKSKDLLLTKKTVGASTSNESWAWSRVNNSTLLDYLSSGVRRTRATLSKGRYELIHQIKPCRKSYYLEAWQHPVIGPLLEQTSAARFRSATDIETVGFLLHWKTDQGLTISGRISSHTFAVDDTSSLRDTFADILNGQYSLYCINDNMKWSSSNRVRLYQELLTTSLPHHTNPVAQKWIREKYTTKQIQNCAGFALDRVASMGHIYK